MNSNDCKSMVDLILIAVLLRTCYDLQLGIWIQEVSPLISYWRLLLLSREYACLS